MANLSELERYNQIIALLALGFEHQPGDFFTEISLRLADLLAADAITVSRLQPGASGQMRTLAHVADGRKCQDFAYPLAGSPCGLVVERDAYTCARDFAENFPDAEMLKVIRLNGYVGVRLNSADGKPLGVICAQFRQEVAEPRFVENVLRLAAGRVGSELDCLTVTQLTEGEDARQTEQLLHDKDAENRLLTLQLRTLLDSIPDRISLLDKDLRVVWTNQKSTLSGEPHKREPVGAHCFEIIHGSDHECPDCPARKSFKEGRVVQAERVSADGITWQLRAFPVFDDKGEVFNVVEIGQNVTEKVATQKELVRTSQLAALGELAAGVAHEINNPINGVINYAQLLKNRSAEGSDESVFAEGIIREGDRIARIVKQLLFLAKDDRSEFRPVDITDPLSESLALVGTQFNSLGIDLEVNLAENMPMIYGHAQQLEQLFLNILSNARYALNKKFPEPNVNKRLLVNMGFDPSDSHKLEVHFRDFGVGIPEDMLGRVFQPFVTSKPSSEGTGLGLSISNDIIKKHKGSMHIHSRDGEYTEVVLKFPVLTEED